MAHIAPNDHVWTNQSGPGAMVGPHVPAPTDPRIIQQPYGQPVPFAGNYGGSFSRAKAIGYGVVLLCTGVLSFIAGVLAIVYYAYFYFVGVGIWGGLMCVAAGSVSIAAGEYKTYNLIKAATGTAAAAIICSVTQFSVCLTGLIFDVDYCSSSNNYYYYCGYTISANSTLMSAALIAFFIATIVTALCDKTARYMKKMNLKYAGPPPTAHVIQMQYPPQNFIPAQYTNPGLTGTPVMYVTPVSNGVTVQFVNPAQNGMPMQQPPYVLQPQFQPVVSPPNPYSSLDK